MDSARVAGVRRIAVLRCNAVGDFVFLLPALEALRSAYPGAEIVLLGRAWHRDFLEGRPGPVDRVMVVPRFHGMHQDPQGIPDEQAQGMFLEQARAERFDIVLQAHGGGRHSNPLVKQLGARLTAGFKDAQACQLDRWIPYHRWHHEVLRYLELVSLIGAPPVTMSPHLRVTTRDVEESRTVVPNDYDPMVLLHPCATDPRRCWPAERFAAVGDALARRGMRILVNGTVGEEATTRLVLNIMQVPATPVGALSLRGLLGVISRCVLVVSNDSGPLHLAEALGIPSVGIYWIGNVLTGGPMTYGMHAVHSSWRMHCPRCGQEQVEARCPHQDSFVAEVGVEEVLHSAVTLLHGNAAGTSARLP